MDEDLKLTERKLGLQVLSGIDLSKPISLYAPNTLLPAETSINSEDEKIIEEKIEEKKSEDKEEIINTDMKKIVQNKEYGKMGSPEDSNLVVEIKKEEARFPPWLQYDSDWHEDVPSEMTLLT
jgi:hypothetical protein